MCTLCKSPLTSSKSTTYKAFSLVGSALVAGLWFFGGSSPKIDAPAPEVTKASRTREVGHEASHDDASTAFYQALKRGERNNEHLQHYVDSRIKARIAQRRSLPAGQQPFYCSAPHLSPRMFVKAVSWQTLGDSTVGSFDMDSKILRIDPSRTNVWEIFHTIEHELTHAEQVANLTYYLKKTHAPGAQQVIPRVEWEGCMFPCAIPCTCAHSLKDAREYIAQAQASSDYFDWATEQDADTQACLSVPFPHEGVRVYARQLEERGDYDCGPYLTPRECHNLLSQRCI